MPRPDRSITVDLKSTSPVYRQIVDEVRRLVMSGALAPGAELPSVRRLAIDLGVHHNTVAEAYRTLAAEGLADVAQGKAVRVAERDAARLTRREESELRGVFTRRLEQLVAELRARGLSELALREEISAMLRRS